MSNLFFICGSLFNEDVLFAHKRQEVVQCGIALSVLSLVPYVQNLKVKQSWRWIAFAALILISVGLGFFLRPTIQEKITHFKPAEIQPATAMEAEPTIEEPIAQNITPETRLKILREILKSKNDNDPRLDSDFENLSADEKEVLRKEYEAIPPENRNERGTIVYLLGKQVTSVQDLQFFEKVLQESPCLSLQNCAEESKGSAEVHLQTMEETTLHYPQIMALQMQERIYRANENPEIQEGALLLLTNSTYSKNQRVANEAKNVLNRLKGN